MYRAWLSRLEKLRQCNKLQMFHRECELAETWMAARESSLQDAASSNQGGDTVDALIKKYDDFDRAIATQVIKGKFITLYSYINRHIKYMLQLQLHYIDT